MGNQAAIIPRIESKRSAIPPASRCLKGRSRDSFQAATEALPAPEYGFQAAEADETAAERGATLALI